MLAFHTRPRKRNKQRNNNRPPVFHAGGKYAKMWQFWFVVLASIITATYGQQAPTCTNTFINIEQAEVVATDTSLRDFSTAPDCSDPDAGGALTYNISSGDTDNRFKMVGTQLQAAEDLDAEDKDSGGSYYTPYKLILTVTDAEGLSAYISVLVALTSTNDNFPTISLPVDPVSISESTPPGTSVATCDFSDDDLPGGLDATTRVIIASGANDGKLLIDTQTCDIYVVQPLDFETAPSYNLTLVVSDLDPTNAKTNETVLTLNLQDEEDVAPTCTYYHVIALLDENTSGALTNITCTDTDALPIIYSKNSGDPSLSVSLTGEISLSAPGPDYESGDQTLVLEVLVTDSGNPYRSTTVTYSVSVVDVDDNVPVFNPDTYTATVSETANLGDVVLQLTATDADNAGADTSKITFGFQTACTQDWFALDESTGELLVKTKPVFATASSVTCQVLAYSSNLTGSVDLADVTITITQENSNAPVFTQTLYEGSVSESDSISTSVLTVAANDVDSGANGVVRYSLHTTSPFTINPVTGQVDIASSLDYEAEVRYLILVRATDQGTPALTSEAYVSIGLEPANDFDPSITALADQTVSEGAHPGTLITTVVASDSDDGSDGQVEYSLADTSLPFIIEAETGALRVGEGLDREIAASYDVVLVATDKSETNRRSSSSTVTIAVTNSNDNSPDCDAIGPLKVTPTTTNIGDAIGMLTCNDADAGTTLTYSESGGDPNTIFQVDPNNGELRLVTAYVYGSYSYLVTVSDSGSPAKTTLVPVEILVEADLDFVGLPDTKDIAEDFPLADIVYNVSAQGAYDLVTYSIQSGNAAGKFSIHPSLGQVRLVSALDRESTSSYVLTIRATTTNGQTLDETLTITVTDVNDNTPQFANSFTNISLTENVGIPVTLATLAATDVDLGTNAQVDYAISAGNTGGAFTIDSSGRLILSSPLDYENTQYFKMTVTATDHGSPALTGSTDVYVTVENLDDNVVVISPTGGVVSLTLAEDTAVGATAVQVDATDADLGTELNYELTFGNDFGFFSINPNTGAVYVALPLDRETTEKFSIGVEVNSTQGQSATATLSITVTDVNDNDPTFHLGNYVFEVPHGTVAGTTVGTLTVTDADSTSPNNDVTLSVLSGDDDNHFSFSGQNLQTVATLDANTKDLYTLVVSATDGGSPARSGSAYVTVHVAAEFKEPSFSPDTASITVEETRTPGSIIFDSDATASGASEEPTGDLQYSISSGNAAGKFFVEEYTGAVQLLKPLSYAEQTSYTLGILAVNKLVPNTLSDLFTLSVTVTQVNKHDPVFSQETYSWTISEAAAVGTQVGTVSATDADLGAYGSVSYALESSSVFSLDATSGVVTLNTALEYSQDKSYHYYVTATDNAGNTSRTATAVLMITVIDVNNHAPTFAGSPYTVSVPETLPSGSSIFVTRAEDLDSGSFGDVTYSIVSGNTDNFFAIDASTGTLTLAAALDYETTTQFNLTVHASDGGSPSLTGTATVTVDVLDMNDNAPTFDPSRLDLQTETDRSALAVVTTVVATDADSSGSDGEFNYVIQSGNDAGIFSIDTVTGEIKTTQNLDSAAGFYNLEVVAVDQGLRPMTGTTVVGIAVQAVTSPGTGDYAFIVNENEDDGEVVGTIPRDGSLTITSYSITGGNFESSFAISTSAGKDGVITTTKSLDREEYPYYQLQVDVNHSTGVKSLTVIITVTDDNDNFPVLSPNPTSITMVENLPMGTVLGTVSATDADEAGVNSQLTYALSDATPLGPIYFAVDSTSGEITLASSVSYEMLPFIEFQVVVTDAGGTVRTSTATVEVTIVNIAEVVTYTEMDTSSFVSAEFPYDLAHREVAYTLSSSDFNVTPATSDVLTYRTVHYGVFNVDSSTGAMSLYLPERVQEVTSIFQWVIMEVRSGATTAAHVGLVRLDTFNRDKHLIAVVSSSDEADLQANGDTLETHLQTFYTSPNQLKIWRTEDITPVLTRRRLLSSESVALALVLTDSSVNSLDQFDRFKTYLDQDDALAPLRTSSDGTPATNVSGQPVPVSSVLAFVSGEHPASDGEDGGDDGLGGEVIALIVVAAVAALTAVVGTLVLLFYCCRCCEERRSQWREDRKALIDNIKQEQNKKEFAPIEEVAVTVTEEDAEAKEKPPAQDTHDNGKKHITIIEEIEEIDEDGYKSKFSDDDQGEKEEKEDSGMASETKLDSASSGGRENSASPVSFSPVPAAEIFVTPPTDTLAPNGDSKQELGSKTSLGDPATRPGRTSSPAPGSKHSGRARKIAVSQAPVTQEKRAPSPRPATSPSKTQGQTTKDSRPEMTSSVPSTHADLAAPASPAKPSTPASPAPRPRVMRARASAPPPAKF